MKNRDTSKKIAKKFTRKVTVTRCRVEGRDEGGFTYRTPKKIREIYESLERPRKGKTLKIKKVERFPFSGNEKSQTKESG